MKKLILSVLTVVSTIGLVASEPPSSPTKTGYTRKKVDGAQKRARDQYFAQQGKYASRKKARDRFAAKKIQQSLFDERLQENK